MSLSAGTASMRHFLDDRMTHFRPFRSVIFLSQRSVSQRHPFFIVLKVIADISHEYPLSFHYLMALSAFISFETTDAFNNTGIKS